MFANRLIDLKKAYAATRETCQMPQCFFTVAEQKDVRRHVERAHNTWAKKLWEVNDQFACELCAKSFTRQDNLQKHQRNQHIASLSNTCVRVEMSS